MHGILHVRIRGGPGRVTARVYPTPMITQEKTDRQAQDRAGSVCPVAQTGRSLVQAKPTQTDRGPATVPLRGAAGAFLVPWPDR